MYLDREKQLAGLMRSLLRVKYEIEVESIPTSIPPELKFGELAGDELIGHLVPLLSH